MSRFQSTLLPKLKDTETETEVRKLGLDLLKKINEVSAGGSISPLTKSVTSSVIFRLPTDQSIYTIFIPSTYLVASAGGPFTLTITTGSGSTVIVPIAASGDTITSGDLLFDVLVDSSGNCTSKAWIVSGSNSNGQHIKWPDGTLRQWGKYRTASKAANSETFDSRTFPLSFVGDYSGQASISSASAGAGQQANFLQWGDPATTFVITVKAHSGVAQVYDVYWEAIGRWRA